MPTVRRIGPYRFHFYSREFNEPPHILSLRVQGRALRWESLDEDILIEDVLSGRFPRDRQKVA